MPTKRSRDGRPGGNAIIFVCIIRIGSTRCREGRDRLPAVKLLREGPAVRKRILADEFWKLVLTNNRIELSLGRLLCFGISWHGECEEDDDIDGLLAYA